MQPTAQFPLGMALACFVAMLVPSCATSQLTGQSATATWEEPADCMRRQVELPSSRLTEIAEACGGTLTAGNPALTGIQRANSAVHAAKALLAMSETTDQAKVCGGKRSCLDKAHELVATSYANQTDAQILPADNTSAQEANQRFKLERSLIKARILGGFAGEPGSTGPPCGSELACLTEAERLLAALDLEQPYLMSRPVGSEAHSAAVGDALYCRVLETRSRTQLRLGPLFHSAAKTDLQHLFTHCDAYKDFAAESLGELAYSEAVLLHDELRADTVQTDRLGKSVRAIDAYRHAEQLPRFALPAALGRAELLISMSEWEPRDAASYLERAASALNEATALASAGGNASEEADIRMTHGETLVELAAFARPSSIGAELLTQALETIREANRIDPTPSRSLSLARVEVLAAQPASAVPHYRTAIAGLSGNDRARARLELIGLLGELDEFAEARRVLDELFAELPAEADLRFETGRELFNYGELTHALTVLRGTIDGVNTSKRAEANFLISVIETIERRNGWQTRAATHADRAFQLGNGNLRYARQACLAHVQLGGQHVRDGQAEVWCLRDNTPMSALLNGMFTLKRAQLIDVSPYDAESQARWRNLLSAAETSFQAGLQSLSEGGGPDLVRFDDLQRTISVSEQLANGLKVVNRCRRDITLEPGAADWPTLDSFFGHYGVLKCS